MNGNYNNLIESIRAVLTTIICFVAAVSIALFIVVNVSPLFITVSTRTLGCTAGQIYSDYRQIIMYLQLPWVTDLRLHYIPITTSAIHHFNDVRQLFLINELLMPVMALLALRELRREKRQAQLWRLNLPFQMLFILILFGGFILFTNFDRSFIRFHYLVFSNMDWVFDPKTNPVILLMPQSFFSLLFTLVIVISTSLCLAVWLWTKLELRAFLTKL